MKEQASEAREKRAPKGGRGKMAAPLLHLVVVVNATVAIGDPLLPLVVEIVPLQKGTTNCDVSMCVERRVALVES